MIFLEIPIYINQNLKLKRVVSDLLKYIYNYIKTIIVPYSLKDGLQIYIK